MEFLKELFMLLGRICISAMFLWTAFEKMKNWNATLSYMKAKKVPQLNILLPISLGLKIIGGLLILFGWHAHIGAFLLLIITIPSVWKLHGFWAIPTGNERSMEKAFFIKEVAVIGGLLLLLAMGAGHFGISES